MPYFLVDGADVYNNLRSPKFHLLVFSNGQDSYEDLTGDSGLAALKTQMLQSRQFSELSGVIYAGHDQG